MGDIAYVRKLGRAIASTAYASGFRPTLPNYLRTACPEIAALIKEMWLTDFRERPAMKDVVTRLEACVSVERRMLEVASTPIMDGVVAGLDKEDHDGDYSADHKEPAAVSLQASQAANVALRAEINALRAEKKVDRHEVTELKAALLAGLADSTSTEHDNIGILGGMFICTFRGHVISTLRNVFLTTLPHHNAQSIPTRSAASSARVPLAPSIRWLTLTTNRCTRLKS